MVLVIALYDDEKGPLPILSFGGVVDEFLHVLVYVLETSCQLDMELFLGLRLEMD